MEKKKIFFVCDGKREKKSVIQMSGKEISQSKYYKKINFILDNLPKKYQTKLFILGLEPYVGNIILQEKPSILITSLPFNPEKDTYEKAYKKTLSILEEVKKQEKDLRIIAYDKFDTNYEFARFLESNKIIESAIQESKEASKDLEEIVKKIKNPPNAPERNSISRIDTEYEEIFPQTKFYEERV